MIKNIILPLQNWLLSQSRCVGCGMPLTQAKRSQGKKNELIVCKCKRIYVFDADHQSYRRALLTEV